MSSSVVRRPDDGSAPRRRRRLIRKAAALVVVAVLVGDIVTADGARRSLRATSRTVPAVDPTAAGALLAVWRRDLTASWSVDETVRRTTRTGQHLTFTVHRAQRPPDSIQAGLGDVHARRGAGLVACADDLHAVLRCRASPAPTSYADDVSAQMRALHGYVDGPLALYAVRVRGSCFTVLLRPAVYPAAPYGTRSQFCFDAVTAAPAGSEVQRPEGTDRTIVTSSHAPATDGDLALPAGAIEGG